MTQDQATPSAELLWGESHLPWMMLLDDAGKILSLSASLRRILPAEFSPVGRLLTDVASGDCDPEKWMDGLDLRILLRAGGKQFAAHWSWRPADSGFLLVRRGAAGSDAVAIEELGRLHVEMADLNRELHRRLKELEAARAEIRTLSGLLPICMYCKNIRNDEGYWEKLEAYIHPRSDVQFSHSICDKCMAERFGGSEDE